MKVQWPAEEENKFGMGNGNWCHPFPPSFVLRMLHSSVSSRLPEQVRQLAVTAKRCRPPARMALLFGREVPFAVLQHVRKAPGTLELSASNQGFRHFDPAWRAGELALPLCCWFCFCQDTYPCLMVPVDVSAQEVHTWGWDFRFGRGKGSSALFLCKPLSSAPIWSTAIAHFTLFQPLFIDWKPSPRIFPLPGSCSARSIMGTTSSIQMKGKMTGISMHFCYSQMQEWGWSSSSILMSLN